MRCGSHGEGGGAYIGSEMEMLWCMESRRINIQRKEEDDVACGQQLCLGLLVITLLMRRVRTR